MTLLPPLGSKAKSSLPSPSKSAAAKGDLQALRKLYALLKSIDDVNSVQIQADQAVETLMTGGDADPAAVLTAVQKADLAFRMMMQMRNKVMQVYQEVKDIRI